VVDANADDLLYYSTVLRRAGFDVHSVAALTDLTRPVEGEAFDLIITSRGSSEPTALLLTRVIEQHRGTPVLALDRHADAGLFLEVLPFPSQGYGEKPLQPSEIASLVTAYLPADAAREEVRRAG
jgi:DNA-binding NtrC family response regulator